MRGDKSGRAKSISYEATLQPYCTSSSLPHALNVLLLYESKLEYFLLLYDYIYRHGLPIRWSTPATAQELIARQSILGRGLQEPPDDVLGGLRHGRRPARPGGGVTHMCSRMAADARIYAATALPLQRILRTGSVLAQGALVHQIELCDRLLALKERSPIKELCPQRKTL